MVKHEEKCPGRRGRVFVLSAPAGTGKSTLVNRLKGEFSYIKETVSCTTRPPRAGEVHGVDYFFMSRAQFLAAESKGAFLESVELFSHCYGTLKHQVEILVEERNHVLLVIDTEGALRIKKLIPSVSIFLLPPSMDELRRRLASRGSESLDQLRVRLARAELELQKSDLYDYQVINDQLDRAYEELKEIISTEERREEVSLPIALPLGEARDDRKLQGE